MALGLLLAAWVLTSTAALLPQRRQAAGTREPQLLGHGRGAPGREVFIVGVTLVRDYETERDVKLALGDHVEVAGWRFVFQSLDEVPGTNCVAVCARFAVECEGHAPFGMTPEKRLRKTQGLPMTEAAIDSGFTRDLYVSLGGPLDETTWPLDAHHEPFIGWIWGDAFLLALGGAPAVADRRYCVGVRQGSPQPAEAPPAERERGGPPAEHHTPPQTPPPQQAGT